MPDKSQVWLDSTAGQWGRQVLHSHSRKLVHNQVRVAVMEQGHHLDRKHGHLGVHHGLVQHSLLLHSLVHHSLVHHRFVLYRLHHKPGSQGREQVRHGDLIPDHELIIKHIYLVFLGLNLETVEQALAGKACTVLFEDLGFHIFNKQHIDPAHQQQHHDVLDCKENQAPGLHGKLGISLLTARPVIAS